MGTSKEIRRALARTGRTAARKRYVVGTGGNISARRGRFMYIKAGGASLASATPRDYLCVDITTGKHARRTPSAETLMHLACYRTRPDARACAHLHPVFSTAVANAAISLGPVSYELLAVVRSGVVRARYKSAGSRALAGEIERLIKKANAILMPNHGLLAVGGTPDEALARAEAVERACQTLVFSRLFGLSRFLPKKEAKRIINMYK
jgi:L-fuculose-phosphate aldolase